MSSNDFEYARHIFLRTVDGWFAISVSLVYVIVGVMIGFRLWDPPDVLGLERDLIGYLLMPIVFVLTHFWYRLGIDPKKSLHMPSVVGVSILAVLVPLIRMGVLRNV